MFYRYAFAEFPPPPLPFAPQSSPPYEMIETRRRKTQEKKSPFRCFHKSFLQFPKTPPQHLWPMFEEKSETSVFSLLSFFLLLLSSFFFLLSSFFYLLSSIFFLLSSSSFFFLLSSIFFLLSSIFFLLSSSFLFVFLCFFRHRFGTGFQKHQSVLCGKRFSFLFGHFSLCFQIAFVCNQHNRQILIRIPEKGFFFFL
jgi:ABC-type multidrug transport system permease subunit